MNPFKKIKVEIDGVELVDISLMLQTIIAAKAGDEKFMKRCSDKIQYLQKEYKNQVPIEDQAQIAKKILKIYKVKNA